MITRTYLADDIINHYFKEDIMISLKAYQYFFNVGIMNKRNEIIKIIDAYNKGKNYNKNFKVIPYKNELIITLAEEKE